MGKQYSHDAVRNLFTSDNFMVKVLLAEFLGTFVLIAIGNSSVAQSVLSFEDNGDFISINIAWGLAVSMGVWVSGGVSGGHINPAVTLSLCIYGRCKWILLPIYWIGQYLGAIAGSAVVFGIYYQAIENFDNGTRAVTGDYGTAGIWATYPADYLDAWGGLGDQIVSTSILMMMILAITDDNNMKPNKGIIPFCVGLIVMAIGLSMGHNCGYAINPARDLGPRSFTAMAGWGVQVFSYRDYNWFWVPIVGPHVGAIIGGWMYFLFVGNHIRGTVQTGSQSELLEMKRQRNPTVIPIDYPIPDYGKDERHPYRGSRDAEDALGVDNLSYRDGQH